MKAKSLKKDKVNVITMGCSKNLVDSENLITQLSNMKTIDEMIVEFNEYNPDKGGLLHPNRNTHWVRKALETYGKEMKAEGKKEAVDYIKKHSGIQYPNFPKMNYPNYTVKHKVLNEAKK